MKAKLHFSLQMKCSSAIILFRPSAFLVFCFPPTNAQLFAMIINVKYILGIGSNQSEFLASSRCVKLLSVRMLGQKPH